MKTLSDAIQDRGTQRTERTNGSSLRHLSAAALVALVGCGSRESHTHSTHATPTPARDENTALLAPQPPIEPEPRQRPMSAELQRSQERFHRYPSDLAIREGLRDTRSFISEAVSDTQSIEMPLGTLRPGYTSHEEGKERQREIISIIAKHASTTEGQVLERIQRDHSTYFENSGLRSQEQELQKYTGKQTYESERRKLEESLASSKAAMTQALQDTQVDKIDYSLSLLRELKALIEARDHAQTHDPKRLKTLSRMCSAKSLEEVTEHISGLERLRGSALGPAFQRGQTERQEQIRTLTRDLDALDEKRNQKWCADYDRMTTSLEELRDLQARSVATTHTPNQIGELINVGQHDEFKIDLAAYRLRNCKLEVYTLRDSARNSVATICDQGTTFDGSPSLHSILVAIDEPNATVRITADEHSGAIESSSGVLFEKKEIDLKAAARSELEKNFTPTFIPATPSPSIPLKGDRHEISVNMNPGGILDLSECKAGIGTKITTLGSGIIVVGKNDKERGLLPVTVKGTLKGEAPLLISLPDKLSLSDLRLEQSSSSEWRLSAGNTDFTIESRSVEGVLTNVDVELSTPRGPQVFAVIRDGERVLKQ